MVQLPTSPEMIVRLLAGAALLALGLVVISVRRHNGAALAFGAFSGGLGLVNVVLAFFVTPESTGGAVPILFLGFLVNSAGAWGLFATFPRRLQASERGLVVTAVLVSLLYRIAYLYAQVERDPAYFTSIRDASPSLSIAYQINVALANSGIVATVILFALRTLRAPAEARSDVRSYAILVVGFIMFTGAGIRNFSTGGDFARIALLQGSLHVGYAILWVLATRGPHRSIARNVVLAIAAAAIALGALGVMAPTYAPTAETLLGTLVLGYGVLRGQIEGLDLKVRFAISKSTVAGIFIAVFFLASEGAQLFFGQGNEIVGLIAAGALVFAMSPLQRAADRLAERAVPMAIPAPASPSIVPTPERETVYRDALRLALRGRRISRAEESQLHRLAEALGIRPGRAHEMLAEVEREVETDPGRAR